MRRAIAATSPVTVPPATAQDMVHTIKLQCFQGPRPLTLSGRSVGVRHALGALGLGGRLPLNWLGWLLRGLMAVGGAVLVWQTWPVARGSWEAQRADAIVMDLRRGHPLDRPRVVAGIAALDRAVAADPVAGRYLQRSELLAGAGLTPTLKMSEDERIELWQRAKADLEIGLAGAPARGIDWLRLAAIREALSGSSREVLAPLFMSIETARLIPSIWPARLRLILDNWAYYSDDQRALLRAYVVLTWRVTENRLWFGSTIREATDELIVRYFLHDEPNAQEDLSKWIRAVRK
ncbi:MAG: hypothetical protein ACHQK9_20265 [Reyranellales bacterium]